MSTHLKLYPPVPQVRVERKSLLLNAGISPAEFDKVHDSMTELCPEAVAKKRVRSTEEENATKEETAEMKRKRVEKAEERKRAKAEREARRAADPKYVHTHMLYPCMSTSPLRF